ncbi:uncharacterized protein B0H64DRAFT_122629 [Chaetomium fimeti]|uniref:Uncharacterized protein n=1 Tax=Chaetomium fimeti TaxID=1854472 RepID=A0AAE0HJ08_9PEZI|nr:hypothetical protein B0H64DRAFT_122629 [Chaetomium fimeti]
MLLRNIDRSQVPQSTKYYLRIIQFVFSLWLPLCCLQYVMQCRENSCQRFLSPPSQSHSRSQLAGANAATLTGAHAIQTDQPGTESVGRLEISRTIYSYINQPTTYAHRANTLSYISKYIESEYCTRLMTRIIRAEILMVLKTGKFLLKIAKICQALPRYLRKVRTKSRKTEIYRYLNAHYPHH